MAKIKIRKTYPAIEFPGSLIQQNFGEELNHGFLVWDVPNRKSEFIHIPNEIGYATIEIDNGKLVTDLTDFSQFKQLRARLKYSNTTVEQLTSIIAKLSKKFQLPEIVYHRQNSLESIDSSKNISGILGDIRNVDYQNKLLLEFLTPRGATKKDLDLIYNINRENNTKNKISGVRNHIWKPKRFEFSNMFSYGEDNVVDFTNFSGTYGIFAPNASGKSALLDSLMFCLYDKTSRTYKAKHILNNKKKEFSCRLNFELNGLDFYIERIGQYVDRSDNVKVDVLFYYVNEDGQEISLNGADRDETNKFIREYIGTYDDFILTTLSSQTDNQSFIDKSQRDRKELLYKFLDLSIFETLYKSAKEDIRDIEVLIKSLKNVNLHTEYNRIKDELTIFKFQKKTLRETIIICKRDIKSLQSEINTKNRQIRTIKSGNISIEDVEKSINKYKKELMELMLNVQEYDKNKIQYAEEITQLETKIATIQIQKLFENDEQRKKISGEITSLQTEKTKLEYQIEICDHKLQQLNDHEYDPNCEFCIKNPFVIDAQTAQSHKINYLNLITELDIKISNLQSQLVEIPDSTTAIKEYTILTNTLNTQQKKLQEITNKIETSKKTGLQLNTKYKDLENTKLEYYANLDTIEANSQLLTDIKSINNSVKELEATLQTQLKELSSIDANIIYHEKVSKDIQAQKQQLFELSTKYTAYEYYLQALSRDGIAYDLLTKSIPVIETEVNDVLSQMVDFRIKLETTEDNYILAYIVYNNEKTWPVELTSGMERFLLSIAFRVSMIKITSLSRSNFLALDEGFGVLDADKISSINLLFEYLKAEFQFLLCISHIDSMKDLADHLITIDTISGYSKVSLE